MPEISLELTIWLDVEWDLDGAHVHWVFGGFLYQLREQRLPERSIDIVDEVLFRHRSLSVRGMLQIVYI